MLFGGLNGGLQLRPFFLTSDSTSVNSCTNSSPSRRNRWVIWRWSSRPRPDWPPPSKLDQSKVESSGDFWYFKQPMIAYEKDRAAVAKFIEAQIVFALLQADTGTVVAEVCRKMGISEATFYNRNHGGGLQKVWRARCSRTSSPSPARIREPATETASSWSKSGQTNASGCDQKRALRPTQKRGVAQRIMTDGLRASSGYTRRLVSSLPELFGYSAITVWVMTSSDRRSDRIMMLYKQPYSPNGVMATVARSKWMARYPSQVTQVVDVWTSQTGFITTTSPVSVLSHTTCVRASLLERILSAIHRIY